MNLMFIVAILLVAAVPAVAQPQTARVTKDDAQKVVTIISGDKAKTETYCEMQDLGDQMSEPTRRETSNWQMSCYRKLTHWNQPSVPNMSH
jgi:hypothetical protein